MKKYPQWQKEEIETWRQEDIIDKGQTKLLSARYDPAIYSDNSTDGSSSTVSATSSDTSYDSPHEQVWGILPLAWLQRFPDISQLTGLQETELQDTSSIWLGELPGRAFTASGRID